MPNRQWAPPTTRGDGPSETFARARSRPQNTKLPLICQYSDRYMQPSPAQPSPDRKLGFAVGACLFPEPGHSRRVCLADQGSLESGFQRRAYPALVETSALLNCEFTMRIDCDRLSLPISGSHRVTRSSFLFCWALRAGSTTTCCHTLLRLRARPFMARFSRFSRLLCPLMAVLLG